MSQESELELWRLPTVTRVTGLSRSEIYRRVAAQTFPPPRRYPDSTKSFWPSTEVQAWVMQTLTAAVRLAT